MRILELGKFYAPYCGGIETLLRLFCEGLVQKGAEVDCVVANDRHVSVHETINGVRVHRCASLGSLHSVSMAPAFVTALRRYPADICHLHFPNPLADLSCFVGRRKIPLVISYHSDVVSQRIAGILYRPLLNWLMRRADRIVVATPAHVNHSPVLVRHREKCDVIPFGLELSRFLPDPDRSRRAAFLRASEGEGPVILTIGRLVGYKGHGYLLEACKDLNARIWIVGTGPLESDLRQQASRLRLENRVKFWGRASDGLMLDLLEACDIFAMPSISRAEAFGLVQVEAMASGKPVVNTALDSGVPLVSLDGVTGFTVPPSDPIALREAFSRLLASVELRKKLGEAGRRRAFQEYDSDSMISRYWSCFQGLIEKRRFAG